MSLIKWNRDKGIFPFFNNMVEEFFNDEDFFGSFGWGRSSVPDVNISESDSTFQVEVAAPGLEKEDFHVEIENGVLTIRAEKETTVEEKEDKFTRQEFSYSSFRRSFRLPDSVNDEQVDAIYENGVLKLTLPKLKEVAKKVGRKIEIS
jgi:HSP20 family protein